MNFFFGVSTLQTSAKKKKLEVEISSFHTSIFSIFYFFKRGKKKAVLQTSASKKNLKKNRANFALASAINL